VDAAKVIVATLTPPARSTGRTHWSSRALAKKLKIGMCVDEKSQIQALDRTAPVLAIDRSAPATPRPCRSLRPDPPPIHRMSVTSGLARLRAARDALNLVKRAQCADVRPAQ